MRIARIHTPRGVVGVIEKDERWVEVDDILAAAPQPTGETFGLTEVELACPVEPRVIAGIRKNILTNGQTPPLLAFLKTARGAVGPGDDILIDPVLGSVNGEGELALVVGRTCRFLTPDQARDAVLGFTCANDVTAMDQLELDPCLVQAKGGDGHTPLGPWIETDLDALDVPISVIVNGKPVLTGSTADLAHHAFESLAYLSRYMTLGPGDVVLTGSPNTAFPLELGHTVSIAIGGIGTLTNPVRPHPHGFAE